MTNRKIANAFSEVKSSKITPKGGAGYDNPRENVDPHVKTRAFSTKEITLSDGSGAGFVKNDANGVLSGGNAAAATIKLNDIDNPDGATALSMGSNDLKFSFSNPASDGFNIEAIGAFSGDLLHVHQHTGNPGAVNLVSMHAVDTDVTPVFIENAGGEIFKIDNSGNLTLDGTVDGVDVAALAVTVADLPVSNLADGTDGELITWDAAGAPAVVAVGTATHVLTSNGVGAAPTFQAPGGGSEWVLQETKVLSNDSDANWTSLSQRNMWKIVGHLIGTGAGAVGLRFNGDSGNNYDMVYTSNATVAETFGSNNIVVHTYGAGKEIVFEIYFGGENTTTEHGMVCNTAPDSSSGTRRRYLGGYWTGTAAAISAVLLMGGSSDWNGKMSLYYNDDME